MFRSSMANRVQTITPLLSGCAQSYIYPYQPSHPSPPALLRKHLRLLLPDAEKLGPRARLANALCREVRMCLRLEAERSWRRDPRGEAERRRHLARQLAEPEVRVLSSGDWKIEMSIRKPPCIKSFLFPECFAVVHCKHSE
jgi:hypothetical protein